MKLIKLTKGYATLVSDRDAHLCEYSWYVNFSRYKGYIKKEYAVRSHNGNKIIMHREIMKPGKLEHIDHINNHSLDNTRENLRVCTRTENLGNQASHRNSKSKYKGVYFCTWANKWRASVYFKKKTYRIGRFDNEIDAALAYDKKALELFGEFALLNFKEKPSEEGLGD